MDQETTRILKRVIAIQAERNGNWRSGEPASPMLEAAHQLELSALRNQLPDPRVRESENIPASHADTNPHRGGVRRLAGNLFKLFHFTGQS